jgi:poly(3-hydroxybutyrate) depolymerase
MKTASTLAVAALLFPLGAHAQWQQVTVDNQTVDVLLSPNYDPAKSYPLVEFLHQNGMGCCREALEGEFTVDFQAMQAKHPSIVIMPLLNQAGSNGGKTINFGGVGQDGGGERFALDAVSMAESKFSIDKSRVYVTGASMGGQGTDQLMVDHGPASAQPVFAAGLAMAGTMINAPAAQAVQKLEATPSIAVHGSQNSQNLPGWDQQMSDLDPSFHLTMVHGAGHDVWDGPSGYADMSLWNQLFGYTLNGPAAPLPSPVVADPSIPRTIGSSSCDGLSTGDGTGQFEVHGGRIIDPKGNVFIAKGLNAYARTDPAAILAAFPGINFVRTPVPDRASASALRGFVEGLTSHGVVVEIEDHPWPLVNAYTGSDLAAEASWYASLASAFKGNPYVWFGSLNEPQWNGRANITGEQIAVYNAIRGAGDNTIIMMEAGVGGGDPGSVGAGVLNPSAYAGMTKIVWDLHFYGWVLDDSNTDQSYADSWLLGQVTPIGEGAGAGTGILGAQGIQSRDGRVPVIVGELGISTEANQAEGDRVINAVIQAVQDGHLQGFAGWGWDPTPAEALIINGSLTDWGNKLSMAVASSCQQLAPNARTDGQASSGGSVVSVNLPVAETPTASPLADTGDMPEVATADVDQSFQQGTQDATSTISAAASAVDALAKARMQ